MQVVASFITCLAIYQSVRYHNQDHHNFYCVNLFELLFIFSFFSLFCRLCTLLQHSHILFSLSSSSVVLHWKGCQMDYATCSHQRYVAAGSVFCLTESMHVYYMASFQGDDFNPLNAKLNPICHLLALLGAHHILHISRIRVKECIPRSVKLKWCQAYNYEVIICFVISVLVSTPSCLDTCCFKSLPTVQLPTKYKLSFILWLRLWLFATCEFEETVLKSKEETSRKWSVIVSFVWCDIINNFGMCMYLPCCRA